MTSEKLKGIRLLGQAVEENGRIRLFHTGQGVETWINGSSLSIRFFSEDTPFEEWIRILVDGYEAARMPLETGESAVHAVRNLTPGAWHHVAILKEVQAMEGSPEGLAILDMETDGGMEIRERKKDELVFIGDSLTSGEGLGGGRGFVDWKSCTFSTRGHYAFEAARRLDLEPVLLSQCGWGACASWDNHPDQNAYRLLKGMHHLYAHTDSEPERMHPKAVVINLGTNDGTAFGGTPYTDPAGKVHQLRRDSEGRRLREDEEIFLGAMEKLLEGVQEVFPGIPAVWCYGMCGGDLKPLLLEGLERFYGKTGIRIPLIPLPECPEAQQGSNHHPGPENHRRAGILVAEYLRTLLK